MSLLIVEVIPYIAFAGAGLLLAWVGADIALSRLRKSQVSDQPTPESDRGLAGDPQPMNESTPEEPLEVAKESVNAEATEEPTEEPTAETPETEGDEETSEIPSSQAVDVAKSPEESDNGVPDAAVEAAEEKEAGTETEEDLVHSSRVVQRDPSVRVFDMSVAPSSRKVPATED